MIKGFTLDDNRLKELSGDNYWKELLDRIRDIRQYEVTSQFANRGFTRHTGNINITLHVATTCK